MDKWKQIPALIHDHSLCLPGYINTMMALVCACGFSKEPYRVNRTSNYGTKAITSLSILLWRKYF